MKKAFLLVFLTFCLLPPLFLAAESVDLLLFNTWSGLGPGGFFTAPALEEQGSRDFRRELLERGIRTYEPDLIGLLELNPLPKAVVSLSEQLDLNQVHQIARGGTRIASVGLPVNLREGMALLVREDLELEERRVRKLSGGLLGSWYQVGEAGLILSAETRIEGRRVFLFITHWEESLFDEARDLNKLVGEYTDGKLEIRDLVKSIRSAAESGELRRRQAAATIDYINQTAGEEPVILMGTLADSPDSAVLKLLTQAGFRDTWRSGGGATWDEAGNPNTGISSGDLYRAGESADRVDYVLIRGEGIRGVSSRIVFNQPTYGTWPSDHYGLLVKIEVDGIK